MSAQIGNRAVALAAVTAALEANPRVSVDVPADNPASPTKQVNNANLLPTPPVEILLNNNKGKINNQQSTISNITMKIKKTLTKLHCALPHLKDLNFPP